jgi:hypothetical protein
VTSFEKAPDQSMLKGWQLLKTGTAITGVAKKTGTT